MLGVAGGLSTSGGLFSFWRKRRRVLGASRTKLSCPANLSQSTKLSYYDDNHYCAMEFRCYLDDSDPNDPDKFSFTLHDDC